MGTTYTVFKSDEADIDLDEHSCTFDLYMTVRNIGVDIQQLDVSCLTPEQVIETALKMLQAASYFVEGAGATVDVAIVAFKKRAGGW